MKTQRHVAQHGRSGAERGRVLVVTSTVYLQNTVYGGGQFANAALHTTLGRDLTQVSVPSEHQHLVSATVSKSLLRCSSIFRFLSLGLIHQGSLRTCVHGAVTVLFVSSMSDSTACQ